MLYENCTHVLEQYANTVTKSLGPLPASIPLGSTYFALLAEEEQTVLGLGCCLEATCPLSLSLSGSCGRIHGGWFYSFFQ